MKAHLTSQPLVCYDTFAAAVFPPRSAIGSLLPVENNNLTGLHKLANTAADERLVA
jgi:hypothetical protein